MRGTNIFSSLFSGLTESAHGRIHWVSNLWAVVGGPFDRARKRIVNERLIGSDFAPDGMLYTTDKSAVLVDIKSTYNCPQPPVEGCYQGDRGRYSVPYSVCRKCTHYIKPKSHHVRGRNATRYACCVLLREGRSTPESLSKAANQMADMLQEAVVKADSIVKGKPLI